MFDMQRYVTRGAAAEIPVLTQLLLWSMLAEMPEPKDYLQIFDLSCENGIQKIVHRQEVPPYRASCLIHAESAPVVAKVYVIDDGEYSTMLLAEER